MPFAVKPTRPPTGTDAVEKPTMNVHGGNFPGVRGEEEGARLEKLCPAVVLVHTSTVRQPAANAGAA